jgi:uncharacterized membrane protein YgdD (TMEM256/DUF423 family)|tara:strand:+ start:1857 stop:2255 length:399 start_codon:yes stop_codon:yes gene_type:complete
MKSDRLFLSISILGVAIGILFGAFGAHALKDLFSNYEMDIWNKGIFYQITNSLGIMILLILRKNNFIKKTNSPFYFLILGIIFFSFSLYAISLTNVFLSSEHWLKTLMIPVTPLGGSLIILGWVLTVLKINK